MSFQLNRWWEQCWRSRGINTARVQNTGGNSAQWLAQMLGAHTIKSKWIRWHLEEWQIYWDITFCGLEFTLSDPWHTERETINLANWDVKCKVYNRLGYLVLSSISKMTTQLLDWMFSWEKLGIWAVDRKESPITNTAVAARSNGKNSSLCCPVLEHHGGSNWHVYTFNGKCATWKFPVRLLSYHHHPTTS